MVNDQKAHDSWISLLDFYIEAGVDCVLDEEAHNYFEEYKLSLQTPQDISLPQQQKQALSSLPATPVLALSAPDQASLAAREQALQARSLSELESLLKSFDGCSLKFSARNLVFGDGNPKSSIMFVGEAPGADEDRQGIPFVGRSGMLLDRILKAIGLTREHVYITNIIPWRPPGNRTPTPQEIAICKPFIERHIQLVNPRFLVTLGGPATQTLIGVKDGILKTRGRWFTYEDSPLSIQTLATLHPAYLLRQPLQKRLAWKDFLQLKKAYAELE